MPQAPRHHPEGYLENPANRTFDRILPFIPKPALQLFVVLLQRPLYSYVILIFVSFV